MTWTILGGVPSPVTDANGDPYSGAVLKAYLPGTTTVTSLATNAAGDSLQSSMTANAAGIWEVSGSEVIPYIDRKCKWGIFADATDAAADTPFYMGAFDNVEQDAIGPGISVYQYGSDAAAAGHTGLATGHLIRTSFHESTNKVGESGGLFRHDGNTTVGKAGLWPDTATGIFHDTEGNHFVNVSDRPNAFQWGALGDGTNVDSTPINAAILYLTTLTDGGTLYILPGRYNCTAAIDSKAQVNVVGVGGKASHLSFSGAINGITVNYTQGYGQTLIKGLYIQHSSTAGLAGILNDISDDASDEHYGLQIENCLINDWATGIICRQARNLTITNTWIQDVDNGIALEGVVLVADLNNNRITMAGNPGTGVTGISVTEHVFGTGGTKTPEGIRISHTQVFGFPTCIDIDAVVYATIFATDVQATAVGIRIQQATENMTVEGCYIAMTGSSAAQGIYMVQQAADINALTNLISNTIIGNGTTSSLVGIQVNTSITQNADHVNIYGCFISGCDTNDILVENGGQITITNCRLHSSITDSIDINSSVDEAPIIIRDNYCNGLIETIAADVASGAIVLSGNMISDGTHDTAKLILRQGTNDLPFLDFVATIDGDATSAISSHTTSGAVTHHIQVMLNGTTTAWIPVSTTDPSA